MFKDHTGKRFGRLVALYPTTVTEKSRRMQWMWRCDCGTEFEQDSNMIVGGRKTSCGCKLKEIHSSFHYVHEGPDLTGKTFGRLIVIGKAGRKGRSTYWHCICNCGNEKDIRAQNLIRGETVSCGCRMKEVCQENTRAYNARRHNQRHSPMLVGLFFTPKIRSRKARKVRLMKD